MSKTENKTVVDTMELVAANIEKLSDLGRKIKASRLTETAVLVLLKHVTKIEQYNIKAILDALPELEGKFVKPVKRGQAS